MTVEQVVNRYLVSDENTEFLATSEIIERLKEKGVKIDFTIDTFGRALNKANFKKSTKREKRGWDVAFCVENKAIEFLSNYSITKNEITGDFIITNNKKVNITIEELYFLASEEDITKDEINIFLDTKNKNITVVQIFNPLKDYLKGLAEKYKARNFDIFDDLANCIPTKENDFSKILENWMTAIVENIFFNKKNHKLLLFIDTIGGTGKSRFIKYLFQANELKEYSFRFIDFRRSFKKSKRVIFNDLENVTFKKKDTRKLKRILKNSNNFIGTTNDFKIRKKLENKIIPVNITGQLNWQNYNRIDIEELWGVVAHKVLTNKK